MANETINIYTTPTNSGAYVDNPNPKMKVSNKATWLNNTGDVVWLFFPQAQDLFDPAKYAPPNPTTVPGGGGFVQEIPAGAAFSAKIKAAGIKLGTRYRYVLFCDATETFAQGNSEPEIDV